MQLDKFTQHQNKKWCQKNLNEWNMNVMVYFKEITDEYKNWCIPGTF